jgi:ABC-type branched-subunit amino acid transport system substrate-binding protein
VLLRMRLEKVHREKIFLKARGARLRFATSLLLIGGKPVHFMLDSQDDMGDPKAATTAAQKRVDDNVAGVIGHLNSGATLPASKIYTDAGVPEISPAQTHSFIPSRGAGHPVLESNVNIRERTAQSMTPLWECQIGR